MTDIGGLIERVEAATGPDRNIDLALFQAFVPQAVQVSEDADLPEGFGADMLSMTLHPAPAYTASIDAALGLVERVLPDVCVSVTSNVTSSGRRGACEMWRWAANRFEVYREHNEKAGHEHMHQNVGAETPPLAILLALLRALSARSP